MLNRYKKVYVIFILFFKLFYLHTFSQIMVSCDWYKSLSHALIVGTKFSHTNPNFVTFEKL